MGARIESVEPKSPADRAGIKAGDELVSINGKPIHDVLDYKFYSYDRRLVVELARKKVKIRKDEGEDLGINFETYLMDKAKRCANNCVFCFVDQMPKGMRETLYFKDDDARMSFLLGNYISLTNLSEEDIRRMVRMRISPVNISVHATNPEIRRKMLRNRHAGECMDIMRRFSEADIMMNCQIVVCPGLNDGEVLKDTIRDLLSLGESVESIAVVPVGITKYRDNLYLLKAMTAQEAEETINIVNHFGENCLKERDMRVVYAADELYIKAGIPLPPEGYYDGYPQLGNGVGLVTLLEAEFLDSLEFDGVPESAEPFTIATGVSAAPFIQKLVDELAKKCHNIGSSKVYAIRNDFFGETINVAGLVTGRDLINQLRGEKLEKRLIIPDVMLRSGETVFLDDVSISDVERELGVEVVPVENDGGKLLSAMLGK